MKRDRKHIHKRRLVTFLLAVVMTVTSLPFAAMAGDAEGGDIVSVRRAVESLEPEFSIDMSNMVKSDINPETGRKDLPAAVNPDSKPFWVYSTYLDFSPILLTSVFYRYGVNYFVVETSKDGKNFDRWTNSYGSPFAYYDSRHTISGLTPDKVYYIRLRATDRNGNYDYGVFYNTKVHTGKSKLKIKSIKMKAVKVKRHSRRFYIYTWWSARRVKVYWYTYKVKVTVKLKKKPGTPGIFINNEWVRGNKKTYKITFPRSGYYVYYSKKSPRHRVRASVGVYSAFSKEYGGCSPYKYKRKKLS